MDKFDGQQSIGLFIVFAIVAISSPETVPIVWAAEAHGKGHSPSANTDIGRCGKADDATRKIETVMLDNRYEPNTLEIIEGETVRFVVCNIGKLVHEFSIANAAKHIAHQPEMMMMVEHGVLEAGRINWDAVKRMQATEGHGMHEEENSVLLEPGKSGEIVWTFPKHADLQFACNFPGHYEAGMHGPVKLIH